MRIEPSPLDLRLRDSWEAKPPQQEMDYISGPVTALFCGLRTPCKSCLHTDHCRMLIREMQDRDMEQGLPDIRYNFLIGGDNKVYEGRGWATAPTLPTRYAKWATHSLYIAFMGPLTPGGARPSQKMVFHRNLLVEQGLKTNFPKGNMMDLVTRREWGAVNADREETVERLNVRYVFMVATRKYSCKNTDMCKAEIRRIQTNHMAKPRVADIKYNFLIGGDGKVYEGRGFGVVASTPKPYYPLRHNSLVVAMMGQFTVDPPTPEMFQAFKDLVRTGMDRLYILPKILVFHL